MGLQISGRARAAEPRVADGSGRMFDRISGRYDFLNRVLSLGLDRRWRRLAVAALELEPGARVLDLATGTGDVAFEIGRQRPDATVVGLDPSTRMLERALVKLGEGDGCFRCHLHAGDGEHLPFDDGSFDAVTMAFGIRNVPDRVRSLQEIERVLAPGGRLSILELSEPPRGLLGWPSRMWVHHLVPRIGALLSGEREYRYLQRSIAAFPPPARFEAMLCEVGFDEVSSRQLAFGACCLFTARARGRR